LSVYGGGYFSGNVGIGTTDPSAKLEVIAGADQNPIASLTSPDTSTNRWVKIGTGSAYMNLGIGATNPTANFAYIWSGSDKFMIGSDGSPTLVVSGMNNGNVGIGTTGPTYHLDIRGGSAGGSILYIEGNNLSNGTGAKLVFSGSSYNGILNVNAATVSTGGSAGINLNSYTTNKGVSIFVDESDSQKLKINVNRGSSLISLGGGTNAVTIDTSGNVGIGTTGPAYKLDVASGGSVTARFGSTSTDTVVIGGGAGKLTVGTVDPVYSISGKKYATYGPESIGVKVGHTDVLKLVLNKNKYEGVLDFKNAKEGDDLWLFAKTTNLASNFDKLTIQLTPAFKGKVWYNKDKENMIVKIYGEADELNNNELEVSYSLSAPRFDSEEWPNYSNDETVEGIKIY
jgi:hypothetical protein